MFAHCNGIGRLEIDLTKADISGMRCLFGGSTAVLSRDVVARCGQKVNRAAGLSRRGEPDEKHTCPANLTKVTLRTDLQMCVALHLLGSACFLTAHVQQ